MNEVFSENRSGIPAEHSFFYIREERGDKADRGTGRMEFSSRVSFFSTFLILLLVSVNSDIVTCTENDFDCITTWMA